MMFFFIFIFVLENRDLRKQIEQLTADYERLKKRSSREIDRLREENIFLSKINDDFGKENDDLLAQIKRYEKYRVLRSLQPKIDDRPSVKVKTTKLKGKKPVRCTDDELDYARSSSEGNETEYEEKNEKGARVCLILILLCFFFFFLILLIYYNLGQNEDGFENHEREMGFRLRRDIH